MKSSVDFSFYLCGPMRRYPHYNFDQFFELEQTTIDALRMTEYRYDVKINETIYNPARIDFEERGVNPWAMPEDTDWDVLPNDFDVREVAAEDLNLVTKSDVVLAMYWWPYSKGATAEIKTAEWINIPVLVVPSAYQYQRLSDEELEQSREKISDFLAKVLDIKQEVVYNGT